MWSISSVLPYDFAFMPYSRSTASFTLCGTYRTSPVWKVLAQMIFFVSFE
jgi:hypothetical protein